MRKYLLFILILVYFGIVSGQAQKSYESYLVKETNSVILKYVDPSFPSETMVSDVKSEKMAEYVKMHPPVPRLLNNGSSVNDISTCAQAQKEWLVHYPYYPQFVPYHLYDKLLSQKDDIQIFETAIKVWIKTYPEKAEEIQIAKGDATNSK
jgi:hypothetical protein